MENNECVIMDKFPSNIMSPLRIRPDVSGKSERVAFKE